jgi:type VI secretion system protein ImpF
LLGYNESQVLKAVRRDLEDLLNTRQTYHDLPAGYHMLEKSILTYGLPDLISLPAITESQRESIGEKIREIIERFEPRLKDIRVTYVPGEVAAERSIRFKIDARLAVDPSPDVAFDTVLELASGQYEVR